MLRATSIASIHPVLVRVLLGISLAIFTAGCNSDFLGGGSKKKQFSGGGPASTPSPSPAPNPNPGPTPGPGVNPGPSPALDVEVRSGTEPDSDAATGGLRRFFTTCEGSQYQEIMVGPGASGENSLDVPDDTLVKPIVNGLFCPEVSGSLNLVFVIDVSGSMGPGAAPPAPRTGSDPETDGSCGRLRSVETLLGRIRDAITPGDSVSVGFIFFASGVEAERPLTPFTADSYSATIDAIKGATCAYTSNTNYSAPLELAHTWLKATQNGDRVLYFITDGAPNEPGSVEEAESAAYAAATKLRTLSNFRFHSVYLGQSSSTKAWTEVMPKVTLPDGKKYFLERVSSADKLPQVAEGIGLEALNTKNVSAVHTAMEGDVQHRKMDLKLNRLEKVVTADGEPPKFEFETEPFELLGKKDVWIDNCIVITGEAGDGSPVRSIFKFRYCLEGDCVEPQTSNRCEVQETQQSNSSNDDEPSQQQN